MRLRTVLLGITAAASVLLPVTLLSQQSAQPQTPGNRKDPGLFQGQQKKKGEDENVRSVAGVVSDPSGKAVEGAVVKLKDTKTLRIRSFITQNDGTTYSDVILALPGDSLARHMHTVCSLVDGGLHQIRNHTLVILDGSELGTDLHRERFHINTRYRVVPRGFGIYRFAGRELRSAEIEEVCVENETLSLEDYRRLLPGGQSLKRLAALIRGYAGDTLEWEANLVLDRNQVPPSVLGRSGALGHTTWIGVRPAADADDLYLTAPAQHAP